MFFLPKTNYLTISVEGVSLKPWKEGVPSYWLDRNLGVSFIHFLELRYRWDPSKLYPCFLLLWGWGLQAWSQPQRGIQNCWLDPPGFWAALLSPQCQEQGAPFLSLILKGKVIPFTLRVLTALRYSANTGMWREALWCSFTDLEILWEGVSSGGWFNVTSQSAAKKSRKEQTCGCSTQGGSEGLGFGPWCWSLPQVLCVQSDDAIRYDD